MAPAFARSLCTLGPRRPADAPAGLLHSRRSGSQPLGRVLNRPTASSAGPPRNSPDLAVAQFLAAPLPGRRSSDRTLPPRLRSVRRRPRSTIRKPGSARLSLWHRLRAVRPALRHLALRGRRSCLLPHRPRRSGSHGGRRLLDPLGLALYDGVARKTRADSWLPTPAIAVADAVLLAPEDADSLLCFDRATGRIRWNVPRANARYVVAANDQRVWVGGARPRRPSISRPANRHGREPASRPAGEASSPSERLYLPTVAGLIAFNAADGQAIDLPQPPNHEALGNLLAVDGALFSLAAFDVYKYPDLFGGYQAAVTRYRADPADGPAAIRLAWLELFRGKPDAALTALATVPPSFESLSPQRYNHLVHLKVAAMLDLASGADLAAPNALNLLEQARAIARSPGDAIHSAVALGDHYHRNGRVPDACRQYLSLILSPDGDEMLAEAGELREPCAHAGRPPTGQSDEGPVRDRPRYLPQGRERPLPQGPKETRGRPSWIGQSRARNSVSRPAKPRCSWAPGRPPSSASSRPSPASPER